MDGVVATVNYKVWFENSDTNNPTRVTRLRHNYTEHPLLELASLRNLAERLHKEKTGQVKFLAKGVKLDSDFNTLTENQDNISIADVFDNIRNPGSWIALYAVQSDPEYKKLVWDIVNSVDKNWWKKDPGLFFVDGYIFISSPPSVTPFHIDRENNFLLQVTGRKKFGVWHPGDHAAVSEQAKEEWIVKSSLAKVKYREEHLKHAAVHDVLESGQGIYMPSTSPHMTYADTDLANSDQPYSITIGVVFYTARTRKTAYIYFTNVLLRKLGFQPGPPGTSPMIDFVKYAIARVIVPVLKVLRRYRPPTGF